ncbi:hypothetical protein ACJJTC_006815, partial [Scirpophaga incertulas]
PATKRRRSRKRRAPARPAQEPQPAPTIPSSKPQPQQPDPPQPQAPAAATAVNTTRRAKAVKTRPVPAPRGGHTNVTTCSEHDYSRNRHFDHSYAQASDDQSPNKVAHIEISELVEPSSSSLTEINTFASTSFQEATTGYIIIR